MNRSPFRHRPNPSALLRAQDDDAVELLLYDEIGFFGITAKMFAETLARIDASTIHLRVNSPGGDVFDGVAIHNALRQHDAEVITHIDGLAASIASVIALAGDEVRMAPNAFFMIHNPWGITIGDAELHRKMAGTLDKIAEGAIASTYQAKTGLDLETIETWMDEETWFNAAEAEDAGFADVIEDAAVEAKASAFDLSIYQRVPEELQQMPSGADEWLTADEWREFEATLRDEGLSRKDAVTAVSCLKQLASAMLVTPSSPLRDEGRADHGPDAALEAARAILADLTVGGIHTERFAHHERKGRRH